MLLFQNLISINVSSNTLKLNKISTDFYHIIKELPPFESLQIYAFNYMSFILYERVVIPLQTCQITSRKTNY